jgi:cyclin H
LKIPTDVKVLASQVRIPSSRERADVGNLQATAVQFIKRFYITNSLMTYHPTDILKTALFFATKTENHYFRLTKFADAIGKTTPEDVLACEFLLTQGLRFTFDVRHPYRALEGAVMELQAMAKGDISVLPGEGVPENRPMNMEKRVKDAHGKAREYLKTSALLTDVYFHFTPSQIMMAALTLADLELMKWYIWTKFPANAALGEMGEKVLATIENCADMLQTMAPSSEPSAVERKELQALAKKLKKCRNPEKMDLVGLQRAKREGGGDDEKVIKKRKLEREQSARNGEDLFGPEIKIS